jgi:hypothetical protein
MICAFSLHRREVLSFATDDESLMGNSHQLGVGGGASPRRNEIGEVRE